MESHRIFLFVNWWVDDQLVAHRIRPKGYTNICSGKWSCWRTRWWVRGAKMLSIVLQISLSVRVSARISIILKPISCAPLLSNLPCPLTKWRELDGGRHTYGGWRRKMGTLAMSVESESAPHFLCIRSRIMRPSLHFRRQRTRPKDVELGVRASSNWRNN